MPLNAFFNYFDPKNSIPIDGQIYELDPEFEHYIIFCDGGYAAIFIRLWDQTKIKHTAFYVPQGYAFIVKTKKWRYISIEGIINTQNVLNTFSNNSVRYAPRIPDVEIIPWNFVNGFFNFISVGPLSVPANTGLTVGASFYDFGSYIKIHLNYLLEVFDVGATSIGATAYIQATGTGVNNSSSKTILAYTELSNGQTRGNKISGIMNLIAGIPNQATTFDIEYANPSTTTAVTMFGSIGTEETQA